MATRRITGTVVLQGTVVAACREDTARESSGRGAGHGEDARRGDGTAPQRGASAVAVETGLPGTANQARGTWEGCGSDCGAGAGKGGVARRCGGAACPRRGRQLRSRSSAGLGAWRCADAGTDGPAAEELRGSAWRSSARSAADDDGRSHGGKSAEEPGKARLRLRRGHGEGACSRNAERTARWLRDHGRAAGPRGSGGRSSAGSAA
ncbi:uncharacterized protein [Miscanthus floridulus]|uniref:uncharacterized protein n=1 Tax=Miscanthus floridulus TaxID=154761 RepID=UPI0034595A74